MFEEQHKPIEKNPTSEIPEILNESDHHFRVDLYMPKQIKQDFDFINRDSTPTQPTKSTPKLKSYKINQISPSPIKSFLDDLKVKDMMTRFLERIPSKDLSKKEEDFELS